MRRHAHWWACLPTSPCPCGATQGKPGEAASVQQSATFIDAYEQAASVNWTRPARQAAWAAGLWVRLFNAKKDAALGGGPQLDRLYGEIAQRLERAGLDSRV